MIGNGGYWNLHYLASPPGYQDPETEAKLIAGDRQPARLHDLLDQPQSHQRPFHDRAAAAGILVGPERLRPDFDVFSYSAVPRRLADGETVTLVPAEGAHLPPQIDTTTDPSKPPSKRASALHSHAARTADRVRGQREQH